MASILYGGSYSWLKAGILYGGEADNHNNMVLSAAITNLPAVLDQAGWGLHDVVGNDRVSFQFLPIHLRQNISTRSEDRAGDFVCDVRIPLRLAAAVHSRRRDPRVLAAIFAPWVIFPIVMAQMSDRYLDVGAAVSAAMIGVSCGMTLVHALFALLSGGMILDAVLNSDGGRFPQVGDFIGKMRPDAGWLMVLIALLFLVTAMIPSRRIIERRALPHAPRNPGHQLARHRAANSRLDAGLHFLLLAGAWSYRKGMDLRRDVWVGSRSIRFLGDISNGYKYGDRTLRLAEDEAGIQEYSDAVANQPPDIESQYHNLLQGDSRMPVRRLTLREFFFGLVRFYDGPENDEGTSDNGNYRLDYLPARLAVMTLWTRHAERENPEAQHYPESVTRADSPARQAEDSAEPVILFNSYCEAAAALAMFALVWVWVARTAKPPAQDLNPQPKPGWSPPHGILVFVAATVAFWYAFTAIVGPPPRPSPRIQINSIERATIPPWCMSRSTPRIRHAMGESEWGPSIVYGKNTNFRSVSTGMADVKADLDVANPSIPICQFISAWSPLTRADIPIRMI